MSEQAKRLLDEALQLPLNERATMAARLLASMDGPPDEDAEAAWSTELTKRARRALAGETQGVDWEQARERIRQRLS